MQNIKTLTIEIKTEKANRKIKKLTKHIERLNKALAKQADLIKDIQSNLQIEIDAK